MKNNADAAACSIYETRFGFGIVAANGTGLAAHHLPFGTRTAVEAQELASTLHPAATAESPLTREAAVLLSRYFAGERIDFRLPLDFRDFTAFRQAVYRMVSGIPYGTVLSYLEVARACGSPGGARAIGGAMAGNPLPILVPCHRVVASSGGMTGFTAPGGIASKRELLIMEGVAVDGAGRVGRGENRAVLHRISTGLGI